MLFVGDVLDMDMGATKYDRDDFYPDKFRALSESSKPPCRLLMAGMLCTWKPMTAVAA